MNKLLIYCVFPAPYRTCIFDELGKEFDVTVIFARNTDANRDKAWFESNFKYKCFFETEKSDEGEIKKIFSSLNQFDLVCIYDFSTISALKLLLKCKLKGIKHALNCDGSFNNRGFLKDIVKRFIVKGASCYFASGKYAKDYFLTFGAKEKDIVVHNFTSVKESDVVLPLSDKEKKILRKKLGMDENQKVVLSVGQFTHRKGYDVLLRAWKNVGRDKKLIIIGGGEDEQLYKDIINELNLENIELFGYISHDKIYEYMQASDLFVLPTREDIWGLVLNEAFATALPVVTTNRCIAGLEMIEEGKNGFLVEAENEDLLAQTIEHFFKLDEKDISDMKDRCLDTARKYTVENMISVQRKKIKEVLKVK